jgi:hypothetical protein
LLQIVTGPSRINAYSFLAAPQTPIRRDPEASLPDMLNLCLASNEKRERKKILFTRRRNKTQRREKIINYRCSLLPFPHSNTRGRAVSLFTQQAVAPRV